MENELTNGLVVGHAYSVTSIKQVTFLMRILLLTKMLITYTSLYCIVLYLYISIALLAVHTNQKRFQCQRPREKRAVLRERKEALGSPVNKVDRVEGRS